MVDPGRDQGLSLLRFFSGQVSVAGLLLNQVDFESKSHPYYRHYYQYEGYGAEDKPVKLHEAS